MIEFNPADREITITVPGPAGPPGTGVPPGGAADEVLTKASGADYDTEWAPVEALAPGVPEAPADGSVYGRQDAAWTGVDPAGTAADEAAAAVAQHEGAGDPHPQYLSATDVVAGVGIDVDTTTTPGAAIVSVSAPPTAHGSLSGLGDDDHPQYLTQLRGDNRYYTKAQANTLYDGKSNIGHSHGTAYLAPGDIVAGENITVEPDVPNPGEVRISSTGVPDHGALTGLGDDDHPQYALSDGSRGDFEASGSVAAHEGAGDPHPQYVAAAGDQMTGALGMGGNLITGLGEPVAVDDAATKGYVDGKAVVDDGYARGNWSTQTATSGVEYLMKNPNVLTKTDNITLSGTSGHTFVLGKVGYWVAGFSLGFEPSVPYDHSRWFLSLVVPGVDGTGALSAYRQSIGPGENIQGVSGLAYSDGSGQVQFRIYNTNAGGVSTNGNFFIKYLGEVLNVGGSSGGGITDHGLLSGLSDDDHPQYAMADGSRGNFEEAGAVALHASEPNPHNQYLQPSEVVAGTDIDVDTTTTPGSVIINSTATGVTDHGALTGLADDDHPQYLTQARGDARYYTESETDALLAEKAPAFGVSIKEYGAVGDGTTDDTAAINSAIAALGANGGRLLVPAGNYRVEGTINLVDGLAIQGESSRRSRFYKPNDGNLLVGVDTDRFSLRDIYLVGPGQGVGTGNALTITRSALDALTAIDLLQVNVTSFGGNGIDLDGSLANTLERVYVTAVGNIGIHLHHSKPQAGATSSTLSNCFVAGAATGYRLDECAYMTLLGCASDDTTTAYHLTTCFAVAMIGCGAEVATNAIRLEQACRGVSIESFYMLGMTGSGIYTNDAQVWLTGLYEEPGSGTYSVEATGPGTVKYVNCTFTRPMTGNVESVAIGDFVPRAGGTFTGNVTVASQTLRVANPSGTAEFVMDRPDGASIGQVVFATDGVNDGWALTHLNNTGNLRIWNFSQGANAMTFDAAGTYINAHDKKITNVTDPAAAQDAATKGYVDGEVADHEAASDPHPQYLTQAEGDAAYVPPSRTVTAGSGLTGGGSLAANRTLNVGAGSGISVSADQVSVNRGTTDSWYEAAGTVAAHEGKADPHGQYLEPDEVVAGNNITVDTTSTPGSVIISGTDGPITLHGALSGLTDDDHPQYLTQARADGRYYTESETDSLLAGKSNTGHTHTESQITDLGSYPDATGVAATQMAQTDGAGGWQFIPTPSGGGSGRTGEWSYNSSVGAVPSNRQYTANSATATAVTQLRFDDNDANGIDHTQVMVQLLTVGSKLLLQDKSNSTIWALYEVTATPTDAGGYVQVQVAHRDDSGTYPPSNNTNVLVEMVVKSSPSDHGELEGLGDDDHPQYLTQDRVLEGSNITIVKNPDQSITIVGADPGTPLTDHGSLTGLGDDDHPQYLTQARADTRYYTETEMNSLLAGKANTSHVHSGADITSGTVPIARLPTGTTGTTVALGNHNHDSRYYTETETDSLLAGKADTTTTITAGNGLSGGGSLAANRTLTVGAGTGITVGSTSVSINRGTVDSWYDPAGSAAARVAKSGDTMTGSLVLPGNPTAALEACPKQYVDSVAGNYLPLTGGTLTGALTGTTITAATVRATSNATGVDDLVRKAQLDGLLAGKADTSHVHSGADITSGTVAIARLPTGTSGTTVALGNHLHTGVYDPAGSAAARVAKAGDTMTGALILPGTNPTADNHAARKKYVDDGLATKAPLTGGGTSGTWPISVTGSSGSTTGNAATASKLATARSISLTGDVAGSTSFDGSANVSIIATVADDSHNHVIGNVDGLQTALDGKAPTSHNHSATQITSGTLNIARVPTGTSGTTVALGNHAHAGVYDPAGTAASAVSDHEAAGDPHPQYQTQAESDARYVQQAGDEMTGSLGMSSNRIYNLADPVNSDHASTKGYVDGVAADHLPLAGGTMSGDLTVASNSVVVDSPGTAFVGIDKGAATNYGQLEFRTAGSQTWVVGTDNADDFRIFRAGVGTVLDVDKASGAVSITKPLTLSEHPTQEYQAATKQYADNAAGGAADHQLLVNLDKDDHFQYAPIAVVDGADPVPPGTPERAGTLVVRENATGDELGFLQKQGGTMTGPLVLQGEAASDLEAVPRSMLDPTGNGDTGWQSFSPYLVNGFAAHTAQWAPYYRLRNGWMQFRGLIYNPSAQSAGAKIANLPHTPTQLGGAVNGHHFVVKYASGHMGIRVETGGDMDLVDAVGAGTGNWVSLDNIGYWID